MTFEDINAFKKDIRRRMEGAVEILHQEFGGLRTGIFLSGKFENPEIEGGLDVGEGASGQENEPGVVTKVPSTWNLDSKDYNIDAGIIIGFDYTFYKKVGMRLAYYHGIIDVLKGDIYLYNYVNRGLSFSLFYKFDSSKKYLSE